MIGTSVLMLCVFLGIAFYYDIRYNLIPNKLILFFLPLAFINTIGVSGVGGLVDSMLGFLVSGGIMMILYVFKALAAGDVKLFAVIGAIMGIEFSLYCMMYTIIVGGILAILILLFTRTFLSRMLTAIQHIWTSIKVKTTEPLEVFKVTKAKTMPFMIAVVPGALIAIYYVYLV
ncbi:A24 family peptidase [Carnobacterium gallinarum]|uniref:A24 family peptidase n=1 Tax=Carnobacterium gallinarum TaxID=2749 RepID=UPI0005510909|nr:prepilin peptidase [Carnobacterium gallinarum]